MRSVIVKIQEQITRQTGLEMAPSDWSVPPQWELGDLAFPLFKISKAQKKAPPQLAQELAAALNAALSQPEASKGVVKSFKAVGPYLNVFVDWSTLGPDVIHRIENSPTLTDSSSGALRSAFGGSGLGLGKKLIVEYSSPNIAKEIALHHLRSTAIGNSLAAIAELHGFQTERINYLGDWGTTHGKLIVGLKMFGKESELQAGGLSYMLDIYVRFNRAEKDDPTLTDRAREAFKKLEDRDAESLRVWGLFRSISIQEFEKIYRRLNVRFDHFHGESMYGERLEERIQEIDQKIGTRISDGALIAELPGHTVPLLLKKADGASLYITRDIAAIDDRYDNFRFDQIWYVVAVQQKLHFQQLFDLVRALGKPYAGSLEHISFGMLSFGTKTMKSREGNVIFLNNVLDEAKSRAAEIIRAKNPELTHLDEVAEMIGMGAILFNDLSTNRNHDVNFDWDTALSFEGDTAPFIQYTHARCNSLEKRGGAHMKTLSAGTQAGSLELLENPAFQNLCRELLFFETYSEKALLDRDPAQIAQSLLQIAKAMNQLYHKIRFLDEQDAGRLQMLLKLTAATRLTLENGLRLLGIRAPQEM